MFSRFAWPLGLDRVERRRRRSTRIADRQKTRCLQSSNSTRSWSGAQCRRDLRSLQERGFDSCRNVDRNEPRGGEQVILAAFVDNAEVAVALGVLVKQD